MAARDDRYVEFDLIRTVDKARIVLTFCFAVILVMVGRSGTMTVPLVGLVVSLAALASVWSYFFLRWDELLVRGWLPLVVGLFILFDVGIAAAIIMATGGWESPFGSLLLVPVIFSAVLFSTYGLALPITAILVALVWMIVYAQAPASHGQEAWVASGRLMVLFVVAWLVWKLTGVIERERRTKAAVIQHLPEGVLLVAPDGKALLANPQFCELCRVNPSDLVGAPLAEIAQRAGAAVLRRLVADALRQPAVEVVSDITLEGLSTRDLRCTTVPCPSADSGLLGWAVIVEDVTDIKAVTRIKEAGLGVLSHELKSPLASVTMLAQILSEMADQLSEADRQRAIETIQSESHRLARLVAETLDVVRLEQEDWALARAPVAWDEVVRRIVSLHGPRAHRAGIALTAEVPAGLPAVSADLDRVVQIVTALVNNALKYTPAGGEIRLTARAGSDRGELHVTDTGCGIPKEAHEIIFEKFGQAPGEKERPRGEQGVGLGLYVARLLARKQGGDLLVESEVGAGATFRLILPLAQVEEKAGTEAAPLPSTAAATA